MGIHFIVMVAIKGAHPLATKSSSNGFTSQSDWWNTNERWEKAEADGTSFAAAILTHGESHTTHGNETNQHGSLDTRNFRLHFDDAPMAKRPRFDGDAVHGTYPDGIVVMTGCWPH